MQHSNDAFTLCVDLVDVGIRVEELLGQDDRVAFPAEQAARIMSSDQKVFTTGQFETDEQRLSAAEGERVFLVTKGPLRDAQDRTFGTFGVSRDINTTLEDLSRSDGAGCPQNERLDRRIAGSVAQYAE